MKLTDEQIKIIARHAAEGAELQARQQNDRTDMMERQREEQLAAGIGTPPPAGTRPASYAPPPMVPPSTAVRLDEQGHAVGQQQHHHKGKKSRE